MATVTRKRFDRLTSTEKTRFINAVKLLKANDVTTNTVSTTGGTYQKYVTWHDNNAEHATVSFLAWHRAMLWEFEEDLITADVLLGNDGNIGIPYWRWQDFNGLPGTARGTLWADTFMGGNGSPITTGPFSGADFRVFPGGTTNIDRDMANPVNSSGLATLTHLLACMALTTFDDSPYDNTSSNASFRNVLEGWESTTGSPNIHNNAHMWVGGTMSDVPIAPNDPVFYLNHANVDRLWAEWQLKNPSLAGQYPADALLPPIDITTGLPRRKTDLMAPWDGIIDPRSWTVESTLNFQTMGDIVPVTPPLLGAHNYTYDKIATKTLTFTP
jgi:tyrosinase